MLTIYGNPLSTCTRKVLCLLAEKNAPFEFSLIDFHQGRAQEACLPGEAALRAGSGHRP